MKDALPLTRYIKYLAESANFKRSTFNKHYNGLIGNRFEMPNRSLHLHKQQVSTIKPHSIFNQKKLTIASHANKKIHK
jgi:hypothetical protein